MEEQREMEIDLGTLIWNFLRGLKKTWYLIPLLALLGGAFGYGKAAGFYVPMYQASASFTVLTGGTSEDTGSESYNFYYDSSTAGQMAKTFPYILGSNLLQEAILGDLGVDALNGSISAKAVSDSNLITMTVTSSSPQDAKDILESAIKVYPDVARFVIGNTRFNMIDMPSVSSVPYNQPNYTRTVQKWALVGAAGAVLLIALFALLRKTIQKPEEIKTIMSLPCLGNIPEVRFKARGKQNHQEVSFFNSRIPQGFKESVMSLQVRLEREMGDRKAKVLLITSTVSSEGKSATALNLAYAFASHGKKVLLIDGDLRKQKLRSMMTEKQGKGLESVIKGNVPLEEALEQEERSSIWMLCGDKPASRIPKILNHKKMKELIDSCRETMDLILIDAPPCDLFEDAGILSEYADCILYLIRHDFVTKRRVLEGVSALEEGNAQLLGYAFNRVPVHRGGYGYYGYGRYGYGYYGYGKYGYGKYGYGEKKTQ